MKAIVQTDISDKTALNWQETSDPACRPGEVIIDIHYASVNRADLLQAMGYYPPPPGTTDIIGLDCSGVISEVGPDQPEGSNWQVGDQVCALLAGGGYAERVAVPAGQVMPLPEGYDLEKAAAVPEVACTVWSNLGMLAQLSAGDTVLIHGGSGGIGSFAIQVAHLKGATVAVTAGTAEKLEYCKQLGADILINYREDDFVDIMQEHGGADIILDIMGAKYLDRNIRALAKDGTIVVIGRQGGNKAELNLGLLHDKRASIRTTKLRDRSVPDKAEICRETVANVWPLLNDGKIDPNLHTVLPIQEAADAHKLLASGGVTGKIVLQVPRT